MAERAGERVIHPREREIVALTYFLASFPLFGILADALILLAYQERSRTVVFHAKQAIAGHALLLLAIVVICYFGLFALLVGVLSPALESVLIFVGKAVLYGLVMAYAIWCFWYAWRSLDGRDLDYPLIGPRLRGGSE